MYDRELERQKALKQKEVKELKKKSITELGMILKLALVHRRRRGLV